MKTFKVALVLFLGVVLCSAAVPQKTNYEKKIDKFMAGVVEGKIDKSYDELVAGTLLESKKQMMQMTKESTRTAFKLYGKIIDSEFITRQNYGNSIVKLIYIIKLESTPLIYEFYFYKATSDWKLVSIKFSDELDKLVDK